MAMNMKDMEEICFDKQENKHSTQPLDKHQTDSKASEIKESSDQVLIEKFRTRMDRLRCELDCIEEARSVNAMGSTTKSRTLTHQQSRLRASDSDEFKMNANIAVLPHKPDISEDNKSFSKKLIPTPKETTCPS